MNRWIIRHFSVLVFEMAASPLITSFCGPIHWDIFSAKLYNNVRKLYNTHTEHSRISLFGKADTKGKRLLDMAFMGFPMTSATGYVTNLMATKPWDCHTVSHVWSFSLAGWGFRKLNCLVSFLFFWTLVLSLVRLSAFCISNIVSSYSLSNLLSLTVSRWFSACFSFKIAYCNTSSLASLRVT